VPQHDPEYAEKLRRLTAYLDHHDLYGVLLQRRTNFAWITGGRDNHIANNSPSGVASLLAMRDGKRICFTNTIEAPRFRHEELNGLDIQVVEYPWYDADAGKRVLKDLIAGRRIAADVDEFGHFDHLGAGLLNLPPGFDELRWSLTPQEIARYREGGRRASDAMERACRQVKPGITEHEAAGLLDYEIDAAGLNPVVTLVAADERIQKFRHPIPTGHVVSRYVMLVTCAEFAGLISNLTRFVHFGPMPAELKRRHQAVCDIDAMVNLSTRPGKTLGEMFTVIEQAYAKVGFPGEWKLHHQGGSTGYLPREAVAVPGHAAKVLENQAFAWNPSITGTKNEDTVRVWGTGFEVLTAPSKSWPTLVGRSPAGELPRADMLIL
jgi:Xaa-Pro aminopeptidase